MLAFTALIAVLPFLASVTAAPTKRATGVIRFGTGNQCLVATGASNGALVNLGDCNGASTWDINRGDGLVRLSGSNFCLDAGSNPSNNVRAKVWTCYPGLGNQQWYYTDDNRIAITGGNQCLDSGPEGPQTYQCTTGNTNQVWTTGGGPTPSSSASSSGTPQPSQSSTPTGGKQIHPYGDEKLCLQILNGQIFEGAPIIVNPCADNKSPIYGAQTWDIARGNGLVRLRGTDYCFDAGSVPANANPGKIWRCDGSLPQQNWYYTDDNHIAVTGGDQCFNVRAESGQSYAKPYGSLKNTQTWLCSGPDQNQVFTTTDA